MNRKKHEKTKAHIYFDYHKCNKAHILWLSKKIFYLSQIVPCANHGPRKQKNFLDFLDIRMENDNVNRGLKCQS